MMYLIQDAGAPLEYIDSGRIHRPAGFLHTTRTLGYHILIVVNEGILYIQIEERKYIVHPHQFIILYANRQHSGYATSPGIISYDWVHFNFNTGENQEIAANDIDDCKRKFPFDITRTYLLPEYGTLAMANRITVLFSQMIDTSRRYPTHSILLNYSVTQLLLQFSYSLLFTPGIDKLPPLILSILDYISGNYTSSLSVRTIAEHFHYNPNYLSTTFRQHTGQSLTSYINHMRTEIAKTMLTNPEMHIKEVAYACGYEDEKYFNRMFKRYMGITPMEYRRAFPRKRPGH